MVDGKTFLLFWLINSGVFYAAPLFFSDLVVTGNERLAPFLASLISGFILAVAGMLTMPTFTSLKVTFKDKWQWGLVFFFVNVVGVWVIARYADLTGVGIANAWVAVGLGFILNMFQWGVWTLVDKKKRK